MSQVFNLDSLNTDSDYLVLDDFSTPENLRNYKAWFGAQHSVDVTDKYRPKRQITWGKPCIWLSNDDPTLVSKWDQGWISRNCVIIYLDHNLYEEQELGLLEGGRLGPRRREPQLPDGMVYMEDIM